jgi:hypothetical protein
MPLSAKPEAGDPKKTVAASKSKVLTKTFLNMAFTPWFIIFAVLK